MILASVQTPVHPNHNTPDFDQVIELIKSSKRSPHLNGVIAWRNNWQPI